MPAFGVAFNLGLQDRSVAATAALYRDLLDAIVYAEQHGLDGVWVGQHHFTNTPGPVPSPLVLLAAATQRTQRIALGTGIVTLPLESPIRLAEDAGLLDVLSGGRMHLGLGTGGANLGAFAAFGLDARHRHRLYDDRLAELQRVLAGEPVIEGTEVRIQPYVPDLRTRVWQAVTSRDRAVAAGAAGQGIQVGAFFDPVVSGQLPKVEAYLESFRSAHQGDEPRIGVFRFVYLGASRDAVLEELEPVFIDRIPLLAERARISGNDTLRGLDVAEYLDAIGAIYGSVDDAVRLLAADPVAALATEVVANSSYQPTFDAASARRQVEALSALQQAVAPAHG